MAKKRTRKGFSGVKMVSFGVRMTVSEAGWIVAQASERYDSNISAYIRSLVHRDKWTEQGKTQEPN